MFLCYYVHDSDVFIIAMFSCFITLLQHVRGQSVLYRQIKCNNCPSKAVLDFGATFIPNRKKRLFKNSVEVDSNHA